MDLPRAPDELELRNIIDKLAQFVARNGPEFELMTKNKQRDNPKFGFLFGGEHFNYYQYRVTTEQAILKQKQVREHSQPMSYPLNYGPHSAQSPNPAYGGPNYNKYGPGPWNQGPHHQSSHIPGGQMPFPGQNPVAPQPDLIALNGAKDILIAQKKQLLDQIKQSEQNLSAQHQVMMQQQKHQTDDIIKQQQDKEMMCQAHEAGVDLAELELLLLPIMESCTKESISQGKAWILHHVLQPQSSPDAVAQYLLLKTVRSNQFVHKLHLIYLVNDVLHHCVRKGVETLLRTFEQVVAQMFCSASLAATDDEQHSKLDKLNSLWQTKNTYFERGLLEKLQSPQLVWNEYQNSLLAKYSSSIASVSTGIQHNYENYRSQHQAFVNHANHQIQQLEQQKQQIEEQIAAAAASMQQQQQSMAPNSHNFNSHNPNIPDYSRPPPLPLVANQSNFPAEGIEPQAPYFDLPAGLMVPLVKIDDKEYISIDPKDLRLPLPLPPTERLLAAVDLFYSSSPSHERLRNADGWEQMALYDFYKNKAAAKKKKEDDVEQGLREASPPLSPIHSSEMDVAASGGQTSRNGSRSPMRKRFRSESPDEERERDRDRDRDSHLSQRERRSRSGSPRRSTLKHGDRSRSRSPSPRRSPSRSRSNSRSNSPVSMPSFLRQSQQQRSPTPPAEMASVSFSKGLTQKLDENNRGHQLLRKMGWGGAGLGANEQGIAEPIKGGEVRDRVDQFKGVGIDIRDPFENFRKSKGQAFITRMRSRAEEREKERGGADDPPTP